MNEHYQNSPNGLPLPKGRGAVVNLANRFTKLSVEAELENLDAFDEALQARTKVPTEYYLDDSQSIITENDSPDIPFRYSLNVYRGCAHGCSYCFARPTHEYLDLSAGLDFETRIFVKQRAPALFRDWLTRSQYVPETITISAVTDCYQPAEKQFQITRQCLQVALEARQPMALITKNALVTRDIDILQAMAESQIVSVAMSITTLDQSLSKIMEPRTSSPAAKLQALRKLSEAGIRTHVLLAPVIPGLTDHEIPQILEQVKESGAQSASYILLRLPLTVETVFMKWLQRTHPDQQAKIEARIRATRGGNLYEGKFGVRMQGRGEFADQIRQTFQLFAKKYSLNTPHEPLSTAQFRKPTPNSGQKWLFR